MTADDPLQQLRDIHLPADPSWWPPAPGWWLLALLALAALTGALWWLLQAWRLRRPRRLARQLLKALEERHGLGELSDAAYVHEVNEVLKRLLVRGLRRPGVAALQGEGWLRWLDAEARSRDFTTGPGRVLGEARFQRAFDVDAEALARTAGRLCRRIRPRAPAAAGDGGAPP